MMGSILAGVKIAVENNGKISQSKFQLFLGY